MSIRPLAISSSEDSNVKMGAGRADALNRTYDGHDLKSLLRRVLVDRVAGGVAVVSSFGTESAVLLNLIAQIDPATPILTIDTGKLFGETQRYRDLLVDRLGLTNLQIVRPVTEVVAAADGDGLLFRRDADDCCRIRKVEPLAAALVGYDAWISGRKRYQSAGRSRLSVFEEQGRHIKINPLALWSRDRIAAEFAAGDLPRHPLEAEGYQSIGCYTCTERVAADGDARSGRWAGLSKTECGIHTFMTDISR